MVRQSRVDVWLLLSPQAADAMFEWEEEEEERDDKVTRSLGRRR